MPWAYALDPTTPAGSEAASLGDDRIREFKNAVLERMNSLFADFQNGDPLVWIDCPAIHGAGPPVSGVAGTGAGSANPGTLYVDTTGVGAEKTVLYMNTNTKASPTWTPFLMGDSI